MTQKDIYEYLKTNPLNVAVEVGSKEDLNGNDYIFLNFLTDELIGSDDRGIYKTSVQITVATRDFENRSLLVDFIKQKFNVYVTYQISDEFEYYLADCTFEVILNERH